MPTQTESSPVRPTALLVLGMHRSGTSAITRVLSLLGAALPTHLWPANEGNVTGYWESQDLTQVLDDALASAGRAWDHHGRIAPQWFDSPAAAECRQRALEILRRDFGQTGMFVLKDPRISILLPFWEQVLAEMQVDPVFVIALRNPVEVAASLEKRNLFLPQKSMLLWLRHTIESERATRNRRRCVVSYDALLQDWRGTVNRIANQTGINWPIPVDEAGVEIDALLADAYRHHRATPDQVQDDPGIIAWVKDAYRAMLDLSRDYKDGAEQLLDHAAAAFDQADLVYAPLISEHHAATWKAYHQGTVLKETQAQFETLKTTQVELQTKLDLVTAAESKQREHTGQLNAQLIQRESDCRRLGDDLLEHQKRNLKLLEERKSLRQQLKTAQSSLAQLEVVEARLETAIAARDAAVRDRESAAIALREQEKDRRLMFERARLVEQMLERPVGLPIRIALKIHGRVNAQDLPEPLFNEKYYREQNPDLPAGTDLIKHFMRIGWRQGRNPHPMFDVEYYLSHNPDVAASGVNPLLHFLKTGRAEFRDPNRLFDLRYYVANNPDVLNSGVDPFQHYMRWGGAEGRDPGPLFDSSHYREFYPQYTELGVDPLSHYLWIGQREGLEPFGSDRLGEPAAV